MEQTKKKKPATPRKPKAPAPVVEATAVVEQQAQPKTETVSKVTKARRFERNEEICVTSGCPTQLGFVSRKNPYVTAYWPELGSEQYLEYEYLMEMAAQQRKFFEKNWVIVDSDVLAALHVDKYYQSALGLEEYETIFDIPVDEMEKKLALIPDGQKATLSYRARQLVEDGEIDSRKRILAIEKALGIQLVDAD